MILSGCNNFYYSLLLYYSSNELQDTGQKWILHSLMVAMVCVELGILNETVMCFNRYGALPPLCPFDWTVV